MRRRRNHDLGELPYDVPIPASAVMFNSDGSVTLETAGEAPVINRGRRRNQHYEPDVKREAMLRELSSHLADLVEAGEMSDQEANDWYNMKADQWAQGLNRGRRRNANDLTAITSPGELTYPEARNLLSLLHHLGIDAELRRDGEVVAVAPHLWRKASHFYRQAVIDGLVKQKTAENRGRRRNAVTDPIVLLSVDKRLFKEATLRGEMRIVRATTPVTILDKDKHSGRLLVESNNFGIKSYGWVYPEEVEEPGY